MKKLYSKIQYNFFPKNCTRAYILAFFVFCEQYKNKNDINFIKKNYEKIYEDFLLTLD